MPDVLPFKGLRFVREKVADFSNVITPPFDVIPPALRDQLAKRSPYSMVHLILPKEEEGKTPYAVAAARLQEWMDKGVLKRDTEESFYILEQTFRGLDGVERARTAILALVKLPENSEKRAVLDHERTFPHKIVDRLELMKAARIQLEVVFLLYEDPEKKMQTFIHESKQKEPDLRAATVDGASQCLWRSTPEPAVTAFFANKTLYIADGHHRFRTAMTYRDMMRSTSPAKGPTPWDYALVALVDCADPGLVIWPTHRLLDFPEHIDGEMLLRRLQEQFVIRPLPPNLSGQAFTDEINQSPSSAIGMAIWGRGNFLLTIAEDEKRRVLGKDCPELWAELDVVLLHRGILEGVLGLPSGAELEYEPDAEKALDRIRRGEKHLAFLVKAVTPDQVRTCAEAGVYMPEKATYFFPKVPSGTVMHPLY